MVILRGNEVMVVAKKPGLVFPFHVGDVDGMRNAPVKVKLLSKTRNRCNQRCVANETDIFDADRQVSEGLKREEWPMNLQLVCSLWAQTSHTSAVPKKTLMKAMKSTAAASPWTSDGS